jgi:hypothetical protein
MRRRAVFAVSVGLGLALVLGAVFTPRHVGGVSGRLAGSVADTILANATAPEDYELPPTAHAVPSSYGGIQQVGGQGEGLNCSLPPGVDTYAFPRDARVAAPISLRMRQACIAHDYCYRHGSATYDYTQADCDYILQDSAFRLCRQITRAERVLECQTDARKITLGVRTGGAGSFRLPGDASNSGRYSTYFEFDRHPLRATEYVVTRIADAPAAWANEQVLPKALYHFTVHRSGMRLRIIGLKRGSAPPICALIDLPADFRWVTTPPLVLRLQSENRDWLVWERRSGLGTTSVSFDGIAPALATEADWRGVFGHITTYADPVEGCDRKAFAAAPSLASTAFHHARVRDKTGKEVDPEILDFHSPIAVPNHLLEGDRLHLFGLATYPCVVRDASTCIGHLQIDPARGTTLFEYAETVDPNCLSRDHPLFSKANKTGDCDRYRDFAGAPFMTTLDGALGMAWLRRGASNGEGYVETARLRWAPTRTASTEAPALRLRTFELAGLSEGLEPMVLTSTEGGQQAFFGLSLDPTCNGKLRVNRIPLIEGADVEGRTKANTKQESDCHPKLAADFLARPFSAIDRTRLILLRTMQDSVAYFHGDDPAKVTDRAAIDLEIAVLPTSTAEANVEPVRIGEIFSLHVCKSRDGFVLAAVPCATPNRLQRGQQPRPRKDMSYLAVRAINRAPIIVAKLEDDEPDIIIVHPIDVMQTIWLKGVKTPDGASWEFKKQR